MTDLRLRVNGREYAGWKSARITRGIEAIAGGFELSIVDRWDGQGQPWPIAEEDECELLLAGKAVISGYVDKVSIGFDSFTVTGRDRSAALVDCSAVLSKWEFANVGLLDLAKRLAEPFGIAVSLQPGLVLSVPLAKLSIDPGDSAFDALDRACRMAAVLPISDGRGGVVLSRAGTERATTALVEGSNILGGASATYDATGRFRRYVVTGQHQGSDDRSGASAASVRGEAIDMGVERASRVLMVRAEGSVTPAYAKTRAEWEAKVRAGRAAEVSIPVQGWTQADGSLWPTNALIPVQSDRLGLHGEMLITQAVYSLDESSGSVTELSLKRPDAYLPEPTIQKTAGKTAGPRWKELSAVQRKK